MTDKITYVGRRTSGSKIMHFFFTNDDCDKLFSYTNFKSAKHFGTVIGTIYELPGENLPKNWNECKVGVHDDEKRLVWEIADKQAYVSQTAKRLKKTPILNRTIVALQRARSELPYSQQLNFDIWLLNEVRK